MIDAPVLNFNLQRHFDVDILHEQYSATIDLPADRANELIGELEENGFRVRHEQSTIYTIRYQS